MPTGVCSEVFRRVWVLLELVADYAVDLAGILVWIREKGRRETLSCCAVLYLRICAASMGRMAGTVYLVAASQDGFVTDARGPGERIREGEDGRHADAYISEFLSAAGAVAMGAETYRPFVADPESWVYGNLPVWVFTHHEFPGIPGADITFVRGDVAEFHPDIAHDAGAKSVLLVGGGNVAGQFLASGLVDEVILTVLPHSLGNGQPLLPMLQRADAAGTQERSLGNGVVQRRYDLRGPARS